MPMCAIQWPPPPTRKYFNLALIKRNEIEFGPENEELLKLTVRGEVGKVMEKRIPVNLEEIIQIDDAKRKTILIEGGSWVWEEHIVLAHLPEMGIRRALSAI